MFPPRSKEIWIGLVAARRFVQTAVIDGFDAPGLANLEFHRVLDECGVLLKDWRFFALQVGHFDRVYDVVVGCTVVSRGVVAVEQGLNNQRQPARALRAVDVQRIAVASR